MFSACVPETPSTLIRYTPSEFRLVKSIELIVIELLFLLYTFSVCVVLPTLVNTVSKMIVSLENSNFQSPLSAKKSLLQAVREMIINRGDMILFSILK